MKKLIIFALLPFFFKFSSAIAGDGVSLEENEKGNEYHHQLGVSASMFSGVGLSYKYYLEAGLHLKTTGLFSSGDFLNAPGYDDKLWGNIGFELQKDLYTSESTRFYCLFGSMLWYEEYKKYDLYPGSSTKSYIYHDLYLGPGLGLEIVRFDFLTVNFDIGFVYFMHDQTKYYSSTSTNRSVTNNSGHAISISGGIGIGYSF